MTIKFTYKTRWSIILVTFLLLVGLVGCRGGEDTTFVSDELPSVSSTVPAPEPSESAKAPEPTPTPDPTPAITNEPEMQTSLSFDETKEVRQAFLDALFSQYGSTGEIKTNEEPLDFAEWYIQQQGGSYEKNPKWNSDTPWCACFLSWGAAQVLELPKNPTDTVSYFSDVDVGKQKFEQNNLWKTSDPNPGDIIFFSWDGDDDPEHVGAVLYVSGDTIYTIEGNSNDTVAINYYPITDAYIIGYGVLNWNTAVDTE